MLSVCEATNKSYLVEVEGTFIIASLFYFIERFLLASVSERMDS